MPKILLVEDEAILAMREARILQKYGYEVSVAYTGEKALQIINSDKNISLILMDIDLGKGINGTETAQQILETHQVPIIFLTSHSEREMVEKVKGISKYGYVLKNSGEFVLIESIHMAFTLHEAYTNISAKNKELESANTALRANLKELALLNANLRKAEEESTRNRIQYQQLFDNLDSAFALHTMIFEEDEPVDYDFISVNPAFERLTGLKAENIIGKRVLEVLPKTEKYWIETYGKVVKTGEPVIFENYSQEIDRYFQVIAYSCADNRFAVIFTDITGQRKREELIILSESKLRIMLQSIGDAVIATDHHGRVTLMNPVAEHLTGWVFDEAEGKQLEEVFPIVNSYTRTAVENPVKKVLETGRIIGLANHTLLLSKNGNEYQIADSAAPIIDDNASIKGVILVFRDVTEQYAKDRKLKERETQFRELFNNVNSGVAIYDVIDGGKDFIFRDFNKAAERINKRKKEEIIGRSVFEIFPGVEDIGLVDVFRRVLKNKKPLYHPLAYYKDQQLSGYFKNYVFLLPSGELVAVHDDMTSQKEFEIQLMQSEARLIEAQRIGKIGSWIIDRTENTAKWSDEVYYIFGYEPNETLDRVEVLNKHIHPEDTQSYRSDLQKVIANQSDAIFDREFRIIDHHGTEKHIHERTEFLRDQLGTVVIEKGTFQDITDIKQRELQIKESEQKLKNVLNELDAGIVLLDCDYSIIDINRYLSRNNSLQGDPTGKKCYSVFFQLSEHCTWCPVKKALESGKKESVLIPFPSENKPQRWFTYTASPIRDMSGKIFQIVETRYDVTELKRAIDEKSRMLQEINHRVKNNLLMISSLIDLKETTSSTANDLTDIRNKIDAIRIIHEKLNQDNDVLQVGVRSYFSDLLASIFSSFSKNDVLIKENIADLHINTKSAVSLGLIVNEVATNAIKHGFNGDEAPVFSIAMSEDTSSDQYRLILSNNGNRFPECIDPVTSGSLGLQLVSSLIDQLDGCLELQKAPEPVFTFSFSKEACAID